MIAFERSWSEISDNISCRITRRFRKVQLIHWNYQRWWAAKVNRKSLNEWVNLQNCSSHLRDSMRFNDVNKWILSIENKQKNKPIWSIESSLEERQKSLINWLWDFDNHLNLTLSQSINNLSIIKSVFSIQNLKPKIKNKPNLSIKRLFVSNKSNSNSYNSYLIGC